MEGPLISLPIQVRRQGVWQLRNKELARIFDTYPLVTTLPRRKYRMLVGPQGSSGLLHWYASSTAPSARACTYM
jgi:hypothetical protein